MKTKYIAWNPIRHTCNRKHTIPQSDLHKSHCLPEIKCPPVPIWNGVMPSSFDDTVRTVINVTCYNGTSMSDPESNDYVKIDADLQEFVTTECTQGGEWVPKLPTCIVVNSKLIFLALWTLEYYSGTWNYVY